ncbi:phosphatidate cytidylyltransferase, partial [candidate division KSB1 bacterium]|nr:phosphatidate cytidylyltransferase [candidate division KSB1 bacterium]
MFKKLGPRVLVAIFGIPLIIASIWVGKLFFLAIVLIVTTVSQYEFYTLSALKGSQPLKKTGVIWGALLVLSFYFDQGNWVVLVFPLAILSLLIIELLRNRPTPIFNETVTLTGLIYPTSLFAFLLLIRESPDFFGLDYQHGAYWLYAILVSTWICDTAAYFVGVAFGKHKLFFRVSPNKTVEGGVAGFVFALLTMIPVQTYLLPDVSLVHLLVIGFICGTFGQIGDLAESLIKRDAGQKDSSNLLPGHGGMFDRFDSLFFTAPLAYLYLRFVVYAL